MLRVHLNVPWLMLRECTNHEERRHRGGFVVGTASAEYASRVQPATTSKINFNNYVRDSRRAMWIVNGTLTLLGTSFRRLAGCRDR